MGTLNSPIAEQFMVPVSMDVLVAKKWSDPLKNIGVYKDPDRSSAGETSEDVYSNYMTKKIKNGDMMKVNVALHEINPDILAIIDGGAISVSKEVASVQDRIETFMPGKWGFNKDILLESRNADGSVIKPSDVTALINGQDQKLTENTDYTVGKTSIGDTYLSFKTGGKLNANSPAEVVIKVKYSCTPDANLKKVKHHASGVPAGFVMVIEEKWQHEGKEKGIRFKLEDCQNVKGFHKAISDSDGTTAGYPCEITGKVVGHEFFGFDA